MGQTRGFKLAYEKLMLFIHRIRFNNISKEMYIADFEVILNYKFSGTWNNTIIAVFLIYFTNAVIFFQDRYFNDTHLQKALKVSKNCKFYPELTTNIFFVATFA